MLEDLKSDMSQSEDGADSSAIDQKKVKNLQEEVNHLENELTIKAKDFKKYLKLTVPDWKKTRDQLKEGEAAIEMIRFQWRDQIYYSDTAYYAAYIITANSQYPEVVYLPEMAKDLENKHYKYYQNHIRHKLDDKESYMNYWEPIKQKLKGIKKIYFSPDGVYHLINISTLKNNESQQYLLDELEIHYTTGSSEIQKNFTGSAVKNAVLIGRPTYKVEKTSGPLVAVSGETTRSFVRNFRDGNVTDLPGTEEEVTAIKKEMDKYSVKTHMYLKEHATEDKLYDLHSPNVLHIATHGYWSDAGNNATDGYRTFNAMVNSGLLMSGVVNFYSTDDYPDTYDGNLTAYEAQNLDLENTSLVILSACETSLGHLDAGEGVYGLQRAFRAAGAQKHHDESLESGRPGDERLYDLIL